MLLVVLTPCWKIVVVAGGTLTYNVSICKWAFLMDRISDKKSQQQHRMYLHWSIFWLGKSAPPFLLPSIFRPLFLKRFFFVFASFHQQKLVANLIKVLKERKYFHCSEKAAFEAFLRPERVKTKAKVVFKTIHRKWWIAIVYFSFETCRLETTLDSLILRVRWDNNSEEELTKFNFQSWRE